MRVIPGRGCVFGVVRPTFQVCQPDSESEILVLAETVWKTVP